MRCLDTYEEETEVEKVKLEKNRDHGISGKRKGGRDKEKGDIEGEKEKGKRHCGDG